MNTTEVEVKSIRIQVEKLDGGFISDITGKRKIYKDPFDIIESLKLEECLHNVEEDLYHLNIDLVPNDKMADYMDIMALHTQEKPQMLTLVEEAKLDGIIQPADKFDPNPIKNEIDKNIKVTVSNAYTADQLKSVDWKLYNSHLPLTVTEKSEISGMSYQAMSGQWKKVLNNNASFHLSKTRIGFTILAKYYEANTDIKVTSKAQIEQLKADTLEHLQMLELLCSRSGKFVHASEVMKIVSRIRKPLL